MAVLQSNRERKLKLQDLNAFITCELCRGYLIKPTTITECLHTFCRSCVVKYLQDSDDNKCPSCSILIHETNPFDMLRRSESRAQQKERRVDKMAIYSTRRSLRCAPLSERLEQAMADKKYLPTRNEPVKSTWKSFHAQGSDQTLEDVIYKLVPKLQEDEQKREKEFYEQHNSQEEIERKEKLKENALELTTDEPASKRVKLSADDQDGKENYHRDDPQIGVCLECLTDNSVQGQPVRELVRKYIRCSSRLTIAQIKKFLKVKLDLRTADQVEVMCNGEIMGKDHTLEFVYMTRWRVKEGTVLTLQYRPRMDFF